MTYQYINIFFSKGYVTAKIIQKVSTTYLLVFARRSFIVSSWLVQHVLLFFPDAECAADSTAILFCTSKKDENCIYEKQSEWTETAIHISTDHSGSIHDKRLYDISDLPEFLTVTLGKRKIILSVLTDRGYVGIDSYHKSAIVQQRGSGKETINRNNNIAFERYFGRFNEMWRNYE